VARRGLPLVISAPSGAGKSTLIRRLCEADPGLGFSVSHTTRPQRQGERDGVDYHFVDEATFRRLAEGGAFVEWAEVHRNLYGTSFTALEEPLAQGRDVILDIDVQGALQLEERLPDALLIFIRPPSLEELRRRLEARGTDRPEVMERRLHNAAGELRQAHHYPHVVVNDQVERAVAELQTIILAARRAAENPQPTPRPAQAAAD